MSIEKTKLAVCDNREILEQLMRCRGINNRQMAKILGVEPWSVGAWLSGKREISAKYDEKIRELYRLPPTADLFIAPVANELSKRIRQIDDVDELPNLANSLGDVMNDIGRKIGEFIPHRINEKLVNDFKVIFGSLDYFSIAKLNHYLSQCMLEKAYINSISNKEYCDLVIKYLKTNSLCDVSLDVNDNDLYVHCFAQFDEEEEIRSYKDEEVPSDIYDVKSNFSDYSRNERAKLFEYTSFTEDLCNHQWVSDSTYVLMYKISLDCLSFKDSLCVLLNRCGVVGVLFASLK